MVVNETHLKYFHFSNSAPMGKIRLILALSVVAAHGGLIWKFNLIGGQIAVQSFFIISGFYMSLILNEKYTGANDSYKLFITNRFLRLYPVYWVVLFSTVTTCFIIFFISKQQPNLLSAYIEQKPNSLSLGFLIISQIVLFGQDLTMFLSIAPGTGSLFFTSNFYQTTNPAYLYSFIPTAWTLGIEIGFYLIAPFILRKGLKLVGILMLCALILRLFIYYCLGFQNNPWTYRFFPTEIIFFLIGYLSYRIYLKIKEKEIRFQVGWSATFLLIGYMIIYPKMQILPQFSPMSFQLRDIFFFLLITLMIPIIFSFFKHSKTDTAIGELSYPMYVSHLSLLILLDNIHLPLFLKTGWFYVLIILIVSFILNKLIAGPIEKIRQSRLLVS